MNLQLLADGLFSWAHAARLAPAFLDACGSSDIELSFAEALSYFCSRDSVNIRRVQLVGTMMTKLASVVDPNTLASDSPWRNPSTAYRAMEEILDTIRRLPQVAAADGTDLNGLLKNIGVLTSSDRRWQLGILALQAVTAVESAGHNAAAVRLVTTFVEGIRGLLRADNLQVHAFLMRLRLAPASLGSALKPVDALLQELRAKRISLKEALPEEAASVVRNSLATARLSQMSNDMAADFETLHYLFDLREPPDMRDRLYAIVDNGKRALGGWLKRQGAPSDPLAKAA